MSKRRERKEEKVIHLKFFKNLQQIKSFNAYGRGMETVTDDNEKMNASTNDHKYNENDSYESYQPIKRDTFEATNTRLILRCSIDDLKIEKISHYQDKIFDYFEINFIDLDILYNQWNGLIFCQKISAYLNDHSLMNELSELYSKLVQNANREWYGVLNSQQTPLSNVPKHTTTYVAPVPCIRIVLNHICRNANIYLTSAVGNVIIGFVHTFNKIEILCNGLAIYYQQMGSLHGYYSDNGMGRFTEFCQEKGFTVADIDNEFKDNNDTYLDELFEYLQEQNCDPMHIKRLNELIKCEEFDSDSLKYDVSENRNIANVVNDKCINEIKYCVQSKISLKIKQSALLRFDEVYIHNHPINEFPVPFHITDTDEKLQFQYSIMHNCWKYGRPSKYKDPLRKLLFMEIKHNLLDRGRWSECGQHIRTAKQALEIFENMQNNVDEFIANLFYDIHDENHVNFICCSVIDRLKIVVASINQKSLKKTTFFRWNDIRDLFVVLANIIGHNVDYFNTKELEQLGFCNLSGNVMRRVRLFTYGLYLQIENNKINKKKITHSFFENTKKLSKNIIDKSNSTRFNRLRIEPLIKQILEAICNNFRIRIRNNDGHIDTMINAVVKHAANDESKDSQIYEYYFEKIAQLCDAKHVKEALENQKLWLEYINPVICGCNGFFGETNEIGYKRMDGSVAIAEIVAENLKKKKICLHFGTEEIEIKKKGKRSICQWVNSNDPRITVFPKTKRKTQRDYFTQNKIFYTICEYYMRLYHIDDKNSKDKVINNINHIRDRRSSSFNNLLATLNRTIIFIQNGEGVDDHFAEKCRDPKFAYKILWGHGLENPFKWLVKRFNLKSVEYLSSAIFSFAFEHKRELESFQYNVAIATGLIIAMIIILRECCYGASINGTYYDDNCNRLHKFNIIPRNWVKLIPDGIKEEFKDPKRDYFKHNDTRRLLYFLRDYIIYKNQQIADVQMSNIFQKMHDIYTIMKMRFLPRLLKNLYLDLKNYAQFLVTNHYYYSGILNPKDLRKAEGLLSKIGNMEKEFESAFIIIDNVFKNGYNIEAVIIATKQLSEI
eukprot:23773_1